MPAQKRYSSSQLTPGNARSKKAKMARKASSKSRWFGQTKADAWEQSRRKTMAVVRNPLPKSYKTTISYPIEVTTLTTVGTSVVTRFGLNNLYNFDYDGNLGNTQPLYFDQFCSSTGPYHKFRVSAWRVTLTVDNLAAKETQAIVGQGYDLAADCDTFSEMKFLPNTQVKLLTVAGYGMHSRAVLNINGKTSEYVPNDKDENLIGGYGGSPATIIFGSLAIRCIDGVTSPSCAVQVHAEFDVEFMAGDGVSS